MESRAKYKTKKLTNDITIIIVNVNKNTILPSKTNLSMIHRLTTDRMRSNVLKLCQGKFKLDNYSLKEWSSIGTGISWKSWSHHPWRCSRSV